MTLAVHMGDYDLSGCGCRFAGLESCGCGSKTPALDGLMPPLLADNRITFGEEFALPLVLAAHGYLRSSSPLKALAWGLAGYIAPLLTAGVAAVQEAKLGAALAPMREAVADARKSYRPSGHMARRAYKRRKRAAGY